MKDKIATVSTNTGKAANAIARRGLSILVTNEDQYGTEISKMSDFFDGYIRQMSNKLKSQAALIDVEDIPVSDLSIIGEAVQYTKAIRVGEITLMPDFDHLPSDIKEKLREGVYSVGESRQVDGNLRAVIVNEKKERVKDITLKQVKNDRGTLTTMRSISAQLQMQQLSVKLDEIQEMQSYQIDRERDINIKIPFFNARDFILQAQSQTSQKERKRYLQNASAQLTNATNSVCTDMNTTAEHFENLVNRSFFRNTKAMSKYMGFLAEDLQLATKFAGIHMQVLDYLGDRKSSQLVREKYQYVLRVFFCDKREKTNLSVSELLQANYPYTDSNRDYWYNLEQKIRPEIESNLFLNPGNSIYMISLEE